MLEEFDTCILEHQIHMAVSLIESESIVFRKFLEYWVASKVFHAHRPVPDTHECSIFGAKVVVEAAAEVKVGGRSPPVMFLYRRSGQVAGNDPVLHLRNLSMIWILSL